MDAYKEVLMDLNGNITIVGDTTLVVLRVSGSIVKIGIEGPRSVYRKELRGGDVAHGHDTEGATTND